MERALQARLDWSAFVALADQHKVIPLASRSLSETKQVSGKDLEELRVREHANTQRAIWLTSELVRIVAHLQDHGIPVLPYKGPVLAHLLYGDVAMRQFGDLDLLLRTEDVDRALQALSGLGYSAELALPPARKHAYLEAGYEYGLRGPGRNLVEIKWRPLPRFYAIDFDVPSFWRRPEILSMAGHTLATLCKEDLLLVLAAHAAKHLWHKLAWTCDLVQLSRDPQLDWSRVEEQADDLGLQRILAMSFLLAHEMLGAEIPATVVAYLQSDGQAEKLSRRIQQFVRASAEPETESLAYFRLMAELRERGSDRRRLYFRLASTPSLSEWSTVSLPDSLSSLYRVIRLGRLAKRLLP